MDSAKPSEALVPPVSVPVYFLQQLFSDTKGNWELLTGLRFETSTADQIAERFKAVVKKKVSKERGSFGPWRGSLTAEEEAAAESLLAKGNYEILFGSIVEGEEEGEPVMHVNYYVTMLPQDVKAAVSEVTQPPEVVDDEAAAAPDSSVRTAGVVGFCLGGLGTTLLVNGFGNKLLAGLAGGLLAAGVSMKVAQVLGDRKK